MNVEPRFPELSRFSPRLQQVTADVSRLPVLFVNVYLYGAEGAGDREWTLIDAGLPFSADFIAEAAEARFGSGSRPAAIILTHGHFDHVGAVQNLAERWDAPVYAHALEIPYLTGRTSYPPPDPFVGGGMMSLLSAMYPRGPIDLGDRIHLLPPDGTVPGMPGWRWVHTPGHTPGHVSLFRDHDHMMIVGDAFVTVRQESAIALIAQKQEVCRPPAYYTPDWHSSWESIAKLSALHPAIAAAGHGQPMQGHGMRVQLATLVREFEHIALPSRGKYVELYEDAGEHGMESLDAGSSRRSLYVAGALCLLTVGSALLLRRRRIQ